jgi:very-short-patch-repair endonuclease
MTGAEKLLWKRVRNKQLCGIKVRRQYGFGPYVLDFYVPNAFLAIEVDGKIHLSTKQMEKDLNKDAFLKDNSIEVIRIKNEDIFDNIEYVLSKLETVVNERLKK